MAEQRGTPEQAFAALRTISERRNITLRVVAARLVNHQPQPTQAAAGVLSVPSVGDSRGPLVAGKFGHGWAISRADRHARIAVACDTAPRVRASRRNQEAYRMCQAISQDIGQLACFDAVVCTDTAGSRVQLRGELDLATAPQLARLLDQLRRDGHRQITLDLSGLEFLSASGLTVFLRTDQALRAVGGQLVLTRTTRMARRVLAITGLDTTLSIQPVEREWVSTVDHVD